jgi:hypothetical protein
MPWKKICRSEKKGGLEIKDLKINKYKLVM